MSTSPEPAASPENRLVGALSHWLARHVDDRELLQEIESSGVAGLGPDSAAAVEELRVELRDGNGRGELEMVVRETLETLALGG
ncbi:MAG: hypothetical protein H0V40_04125 [Actinobacteria bacterium]|nr:hypothetical protein [Actinomycetota bacterium]